MSSSKTKFLVGIIIGLLIGAVLAYALVVSHLASLESQISTLREHIACGVIRVSSFSDEISC